MIRRTAALCLVALAAAAAAQPADSLIAAVRPAASAPAETPAQALDRVRRGLEANPDDAALLALQLRLELDGVGMAGLPPLAFREQQTRTARRLLRAEPANALANLVAGTDDLREFEFYHDRRAFPADFANGFDKTFKAAGVSPEYMKNRFLRGRFDTELLEEVFFELDASGPGRGKDDSARRHLEAAIATDPTLREAYEPLATLAAMSDAWPEVASVAARAAAQFPDWGAPLLWQALAQYHASNPAGAEATFSRGLALLPPSDRFRYEDIAGLLKPEERERYHADPEAFAQDFWSRSDVRLLTPANERRAEHYARRTEADLLFGWSRAEGTETPRGSVWARYGAPPRRTRYSSDMMYGEGRSIPYDVWEYDGFRLVFADPGRDGAYNMFAPPQSALSSADPYLQGTAMSDDYVTVDRRLQREAPEASTYAPARRERVPALATAFRGADGRTDVVVAFGVPLAAHPAPGTSAALSVETGVFALQDGAALPVAERRRSHSALPAAETIALGDAAVWVGAETLRLAPGAYTLAAEFSAPGDIAGFERTPLTVPAFTDQGLELSGLLLAASADEGAGGPLVRRGVGIVPAPLDAVAGQVSIYAEVYGLARAADGRTSYEVELALVPVDARTAVGRLLGREARRGVSTSSAASGASADEAVVMSLSTAGQAAGAYRLVLRVTDRVSGTSAESERRVTLE